jgi:hypothetical protein
MFIRIYFFIVIEMLLSIELYRYFLKYFFSYIDKFFLFLTHYSLFIEFCLLLSRVHPLSYGL